MSLANWTGLKAEILVWLRERDDLEDVIPTFIELTEADFDGKVTHRAMTTKTTLELDGELTPLPEDYRGIRSVANSTRVLTYLTPEALAEQKIVGPSGLPGYYSILGENLQIWPAPTAGDEVEIIYLAKVESLGATNASNWMLDRFPNVYLYGALLQAAPYLDEDARVSVWASLYGQALQAVNASSLNESHGALTVRSGSSATP